jgi:bifunctional non-homologous end joining protein LigD
VLDAKGVSRFAELQAALSRGVGRELVFFAFDLLHLNGWDIAAAPLVRRKALLATLLSGATPRAAIQFSDHVAGGGPEFFERVSEMGLEGVVSKRAPRPISPAARRPGPRPRR